MKSKFLFYIIVFLFAFISFHAKAQNYINVYAFQPAALMIFTGNDTTICSNSNVVLESNANGGTTPYSFFWQPSNGLSSETAANPTANPNTTTTYNVTVSDNVGCSATSAITIYIDICVGINQTTSQFDLILFPTVTEGILNLSAHTKGQVQLLQIFIYNQLGQLLQKEIVRMINDEMNKEINVSALASGNYVMQIIGETIFEVKRFVKK